MSAARNMLVTPQLPYGAPNEQPQHEPHITAVPDAPARRRPRVAAVGAVLAGLGCIVVAQLALGTALSHGAYEISALSTQERDVNWTVQGLNEEVRTVSSPQFIAEHAKSLGLTNDGSPAYLRLSDATVLGVPMAAAEEGAVPFGDPSLVANSLASDDTSSNDGARDDSDDSAESSARRGSATPASGSQDVSLISGLPTPATR